MDQTEFEAGAEPSCHGATWVDGSSTWSGIPLWRLVGYVDDEVQHGAGAFNDGLAAVGYEVKVTASDGFSKTFASADIRRNDNMIIANTLNGTELPENYYPLRLVGPGLSSGQKISMIVEIELVNLPEVGVTDSIDVTANVTVMAMVGIELDRDNIDYGNIMPGESSAVETVGITNIGTVAADVTLEVDGADAIAQDFYEQSLYIDNIIFDGAIIASIEAGLSEDVDTQLQVPLSWTETGVQNATFIFWAEAS
jgi:DMSO/TMAO reductase YedYZ molybdopterin-dependent catalytic subunit